MEQDELQQQIDAKVAADGVEVTPNEMTTRLLDLLWDRVEPSTRGRKPRFSLAEVVSSAVEVADADGLAGVTMRKVATAMGVGAMSLYTYVPGRDELVSLMVERVYTELTLPAAQTPWREAILTYAESHLAMYADHSWLLDVNRWRLPLAPHVLDAQEAGLRAFEGTPLAAAEIVGIMELVDTFVHGLARDSVLENAQRNAGAPSQDEYWIAQGSFWETHFDVERYPAMTRTWLAGGFDTDRTEPSEALAPMLDAVARAIEAARREQADEA